MLAQQPMLFTVQYILSTLLPIPSTWENSHSFPLSFFRLLLFLSSFGHRLHAAFLSHFFLGLFLSTALNLRPVLSNKVYGSGGVDLYEEKRRNTGKKVHMRTFLYLCTGRCKNNAGWLKINFISLFIFYTNSSLFKFWKYFSYIIGGLIQVIYMFENC